MPQIPRARAQSRQHSETNRNPSQRCTGARPQPSAFTRPVGKQKADAREAKNDVGEEQPEFRVDRPGINQHATQGSTRQQDQPTDTRNPTGLPEQSEKKRKQENGRDHAHQSVHQNKHGINQIGLREGEKIDCRQEKKYQLAEQ